VKLQFYAVPHLRPVRQLPWVVPCPFQEGIVHPAASKEIIHVVAARPGSEARRSTGADR